jgi:hypothetical protein
MGIFALELHAGRSLRVVEPDHAHPVAFDPTGQLFRLSPKPLQIVGPVPASRHHERARHLGIPEAKVQHRVSAHRQAADMGAWDAEMRHHAAQVLDRGVLRERRRIAGDVGRRVAARVIRDHLVAAGEEANLRVPAAAIPRKLVAQHEWESLSGDLVVKPHAVHESLGHVLPPPAVASMGLATCAAVRPVRHARGPRRCRRVLRWPTAGHNPEHGHTSTGSAVHDGDPCASVGRRDGPGHQPPWHHDQGQEPH